MRRGVQLSLIGVFGCFCLLALVAMPAAAQEERGPFEFTLAGSGSSDKDFDGTQFSGDLGLGYHLGPIVLGVRQTVSYNQSPTEAVDDFWSGSTRAFADLEIEIGPVAPFVGGNVGYIYGDLVDNQFIAGPEFGVKLYVGSEKAAFIFVRAEYQFFFEDSEGADDAFNDGQWVYALGVGLRF